jgi:hypothetical protein
VYSAAFCSFIANNAGVSSTSPYAGYGGNTGASSYAYLGDFEVLLSDPAGSRPFMAATAAHETGHVFWACDEYAASNCTCAVCDNYSYNRPPANNAPNNNCEPHGNVSCGPTNTCIMLYNSAAFAGRYICSYTAQHVGWPAYPCFDSVPSTHWGVTYYNDPLVGGAYQHFTNPVSRKDEGSGFLTKDWGTGSPSTTNCPVNSDHFSAYFSIYPSFTEGIHTFTTTADDGVRIVVDSTTVIDHLVDQPPTTYTGDVYVTAGTHLVKVYYYDATGGATLHVSWN